MGHKVPATSLDAYKSQDESHIRKQYDGIVSALKVLKSASAEQIANHLKMQHVQINRRMSEMERLQMVWKPGGRVPTVTGRTAFAWQLTSEPDPIPTPVIKEPKFRSKSIAEHSKAIQKIQKQTFNQIPLF